MPPQPTRPLASVVIPAHDEERVIQRCLRTLLDGAEPGELEVVVVANGCKDGTADLARRVDRSVTVIELEEASKHAALNAGDRAVHAFPRAYLDADIELDAATLRGVVELLGRGEALCSAPPMRTDTSGAPWFIRAFYRAFEQLPYLADDLVGHGVYVLSEAGRARFEEFPDLTADDLYVRNLFARDERRSSAVGEFVVRPPRTLSGLLAIRRRAYRGNEEYERLGHRSAAEPTLAPRRMLANLVRDPVAGLVFVVVNLVAKLQVRFGRQSARWERDDSSRS